MKRAFYAFVGLVILAAGISTGTYFMRTKPKAKRKMRARLTPVVECKPLQRGEHRVRLDVLGTVIPARQIVAQSRVSGQIVKLHSEWIEGGRVGKGDILAQIDPADYEIALQQAKAELAQAESDALLEQGRRDVARQEWQMLGDSVEASESDRELALRVPQQKSAEARITAARARVARSQLDLDRTAVRAPFNALILQRHANLGDQATGQARLATLVDTDSYHVRVSVPVDELKWVSWPTETEDGSAAEIHFPDGSTCKGKVVGRLEDLEATGRMARLLVEIPEPFTQNAPVLINSFVRVVLEGNSVGDVYEIDRTAYRDGSVIWLITAENTLRILNISPIRSGRDTIVFRADIAEGERLITTALGAPIDGMELRLPGETRPERPEGVEQAERMPQRKPREKTR